MYDPEKPDGCEKTIRFGCGFLFGGIVLLVPVAQSVYKTGNVFWLVVGIGAFICGLLAIRYGDRFFNAFFKWFGW
jgi:hypothetical protein